MVRGNGRNQFSQYARQNVGNQIGYNAVQNAGNQVVHNVVQNLSIHNVINQNRLIVVPEIANQNANQNGNGNVIAAQVEGNSNGNNPNQIRCYNCKGVGHYARNWTVRPRRRDIEEVNANCILMANLQEASTSGTQADKAPIYDSDGSAEVHQHENYSNNDIFNMFTQEEHYIDLLDSTTEPSLVQRDEHFWRKISLEVGT
ncbi:retrovirus-related pol polyprotein from transposon TNT 1-94 [Tanacetum coccineum]